MYTETDPKKIEVIIPTKQRTDKLWITIQSLAEQTTLPDRVIIIDDSDEDVFQLNRLRVKDFNETSPNIEIDLMRGSGEGAGHARNQGIERISGDIVLFLDDDVILDTNYIESIRHCFSNPEIAGAGGIIKNYPESNRWEILLKRIFLLSDYGNDEAYMKRSGYPRHLRNCSKMIEVNVLSGCNMAFKSSVLKQYRFDNRLRGYSYLEDADLSYRIALKYKVVATPNARLIHNTQYKSSSKKFQEIKIYYHYLIFKKIKENGDGNWFAFYLSMIGNFIQSSIGSLLHKNIGLISGYSRGLMRIIQEGGNDQTS